LSDFFDTPIEELLGSTAPKKKMVKSTEDIMMQILRADMEMMLKYGRNGHNLDFPDPVEPQWKN
jgi:DUF2075 family protein